MSTVESSNECRTRLEPSDAPAYVRKAIASSLNRCGFDGAEAGALAEVERLLEHHVQRLFESASSFAELAHRHEPNAMDLYEAHEEARRFRSLRREAKRKRAPLTVNTVEEPPEPVPPVTLDKLPPLESGSGEDVKPSLSASGSATMDKKGPVPAYAYDWAPGLPNAWTFAYGKSKDDRAADSEPPGKITPASLEFIKASATHGDIPPELGIVNYRLHAKKHKSAVPPPGLGATAR